MILQNLRVHMLIVVLSVVVKIPFGLGESYSNGAKSKLESA